MMETKTEQQWNEYCAAELTNVTALLTAHGYTLDAIQPHLKGERFLMHAVTTTSGLKLILLGNDARGARVVIKASNNPNGINEINHERLCRQILSKIDFARDIFHSPREIEYIREQGYVVGVQEFIPQTSTFLERTLIEQFNFALAAFKGQEGAHATTYKHRRLIQGVFNIRSARTYAQNFSMFIKNIHSASYEDEVLFAVLKSAHTYLEEHALRIEQYCGFLTHTDFVPHNIRIKDDTMYLLDHSSLTFGNKYEGWARFINFMTLYNPPLQRALEQYVRDNRTWEEEEALHLMRIYRLGEIIWYYVNTIQKSAGDLHTLNTRRIHFWGIVLSCVLKNEEVPQHVITDYTTKRDALRSQDEKQRQRGLH